jgi:hypothetical protein
MNKGSIVDHIYAIPCDFKFSGTREFHASLTIGEENLSLAGLRTVSSCGSADKHYSLKRA